MITSLALLAALFLIQARMLLAFSETSLHEGKIAPLGTQHVTEMCCLADVIDISTKKVTVVGLIREHDKAVTSPNLAFKADKSLKIKKHMRTCDCHIFPFSICVQVRA